MNVKYFCISLLWCITHLCIADTLFLQQQALAPDGTPMHITTRLMPEQGNGDIPTTHSGQLQLIPSQPFQMMTLCGELTSINGMQLIRTDHFFHTYQIVERHAEIEYSQLNLCSPRYNEPYDFGFVHSAQAFVLIKKERQKDSVIPQNSESGLIYNGGSTVIDNKPGDDFYRPPFTYTASNWLINIVPPLLDPGWMHQFFDDPAVFLPAMLVIIQPPDGAAPVKISVSSRQVPHMLKHLGDISQLLQWLAGLIPGRQDHYIGYLLELSDHLINNESLNPEFLSFLREQVEELVQKNPGHNDLQLVISWSEQQINRFNAEMVRTQKAFDHYDILEQQLSHFMEQREVQKYRSPFLSEEMLTASEKNLPKSRFENDSFLDVIRDLKTLREDVSFSQLLTVMPLAWLLDVQMMTNNDRDQIILRSSYSEPLPETTTLTAHVREGIICSYCCKPLLNDIVQSPEAGERFHRECYPHFLMLKNKVPPPPTGGKMSTAAALEQYSAQPDRAAEKENKKEVICFSCSACKENIRCKFQSDFPDAEAHLRSHYRFCSPCNEWLYFEHAEDADSGYEVHIKHCSFTCRGCGKLLSQKEKATHGLVCPNTIVTCSSCGCIFYRKNFLNHIYENPKQHYFMKCPFGDCKKTKNVLGYQLKQHIDKFHTPGGTTPPMGGITYPEGTKVTCGYCFRGTTSYSVDKILKHTFMKHTYNFKKLLEKAKNPAIRGYDESEEHILSILRNQYQELEPSDDHPQ